jgi:hypothetical protein
LIHSGFLDILSLIPSSQPEPYLQSHYQRTRNLQGRPEDDLRAILRDNATPISGLPKDKEKRKQEKRMSGDAGLRKRRIDKGMIGPPMDFRSVPISDVMRRGEC